MKRILSHQLFLWFCIFSLTTISLIFLFAIANQNPLIEWTDIFTIPSAAKMRSQFVWVGISILISIFIYYVVNQNILSFFAYPLYIFNILLLLITVFIANNVRGSSSWISIGGINFQPAELSKIIVAIVLAKFCSTEKFINNTKSKLIILGIILIPVLLIIAQKEVGQVLIYLSLFIPLYMQGISIKYVYLLLANVVSMYLVFVADMVYVDTTFITVVLLTLFYHIAYKVKIKNKLFYYGKIAFIMAVMFTIYHVIIPFAVNNFMQPHHIKRIVSIVDAEKKERDWMNQKTQDIIQNTNFKAIKYNVRQADIAIGSGGFFGKGINRSTQMKLSFIPEQHTDFIFSAIGEGWGVAGCVLVLFIYFLLLWHLLILAKKQKTTFGMFLIYASWGYIFFYVMINVGMVIGLFPVVGIPLPWISYGGSSFVTNTAMMAIIFKFAKEKRLLEK